MTVALHAFAHQGFHGTSMNDVADAAGVTKPVLYQHFNSKQDLYAALADDVGRRMLGAITTATAAATTGHARTQEGFRAYFRWVAEDRDAFLLLFGSRAGSDEQSTMRVRALTSGVATAIEPLIDADIAEDHRRTLAHGLVGLAEGVSRYLVERGEPIEPDTLADQVTVLAWAGLRGVGRPAGG